MVLKCKMCGAPLTVGENDHLTQCRYCDSMQTLPHTDDDLKLKLFDRATELRLACDFDQAANVFQSIVAQFPEEAEAYWGLVLCKYGIEYVDDPRDSKKVPTCHRTRRQSVFDDLDYQAVCRYADAAKWKYEEEATAIDKLQRSILDISRTEKPCDIFICYKETDDAVGHRTEDSIVAQDIYTELSKDYKVFFARVSLREKAGTEYEPYIYAALSSAKIMLVIGSKAEYFEAVWVKNEWSRYLEMIQDDPTKRIIPCYESITPEQLPRRLQRLQALDMSNKLFFTNLTNIIRDVFAAEHTAAPSRVEQIKAHIAQKKAEAAPPVQKLPIPGGVYIGCVLDGQPHGHGVNHYNNGGTFEGNWDHGMIQGDSLYTYPTGETLAGVWKDNQMISGNGTLHQYIDGKPSGDVYVGEIKGSSEKHGRGTFKYATGETWTGEWKNDRQWNGQGFTLYYSFGRPIGGYHKGATVDGAHHGEGEEKLTRDGTLFRGSWVNGKREGHGTLTYYNLNKSWVGEWKDDIQWNGQGSILYRENDKPTGEEYNGTLKNGKREGHGTFIAANGDRYEGEWENDKRKGHGTFIAKNGDRYEGEWENDRPWNGEGTVWFYEQNKPSSYFQGSFRNGEFYTGKLFDAQGKVISSFRKGEKKHGLFGLF